MDYDFIFCMKLKFSKMKLIFFADQEVLADILMTHLNDTERKRQGYIKELISTEQAYIDDMKLVHEVRQILFSLQN